MSPAAVSRPKARAADTGEPRAKAKKKAAEDRALRAPAAQPHDADLAIGARARHLRRARGLRLEDMAAHMGVSIGYLSQIERGLSSPSVRALVKLAEALDAPLASLVTPSQPPGHGQPEIIVRAQARDALILWRTGVSKQLLTPPGAGAISMFLVELAPGAESGDALYVHAGEESGFVLEGAISLTVEDHTWRLAAGDSFRFRSDRPHRFGNPEAAPARVLWINVDPNRAG